MTASLYHSNIHDLELLHRGKVRDLYAVDAEHLLIVATDRLSAFDVVLPDPIPSKGAVLTRLSRFWFQRTQHLIPNHLVTRPLKSVIVDPVQRANLGERATLVRRLQPLPVEAIVRGYIIGSAWKDYQRTGQVCGIALPSGLQLADRLPTPIFTPSTKAAQGAHDENIDLAQMQTLLGRELAEQIRTITLALYQECAAYAQARGILIADTKLEFGCDAAGQLVLIDELLTPDSSRFWPADAYQPGHNPPSFDKQGVRDYLETLAWDKTPPGPLLPPTLIARTAEQYREVERCLTGA